MKKLLIVVDYQNDFVSGSLGFDKALTLDTKIAEKIAEYKSRGDEVIFTLDTHYDDYLDTQEGKNLPVAHCIKGSDGHCLYGRVGQLLEGCIGLEKETFGASRLLEFLSGKHFESIELVGVVTNICVISNAIIAKAALPETLIIVDASCCASNDETLHSKALDVMQGLQIQVVNR